MTKLLVIADDFTGALDTGVQFAGKGIATKVLNQFSLENTGLTEAEVWVIDAETRHLTREQAYEQVYQIVKKARKINIHYIYKKTDSGLRGNVGSELEAALDASGERYLTFVPALPGMNRITKSGIHYIDGIPLKDSVFGRDPFEPVSSSYVPDLFSLVSTAVALYPIQAHYIRPNEKEIGIFDAASDEDIQNIAKDLIQQNKIGVMAGCAGFASVIADWIGLKHVKQPLSDINRQMVIVCGSVNEITRKQIDYAEKTGMKRITMTPQQQLHSGYLDSAEGRQWLRKLKQECESGRTCMIETGFTESQAMDDYRNDHNISLEEARVMIAEALGGVMRELLDMGLDSTIMVIGGDTLAGFVSQMECSEISIHDEIEPGTVLSSILVNGREQWLISKSGGFGGPDLLSNIEKRIKSGRI